MVAGFHLTEAIANRYSLGMAESEIAKVDRGFLAVPGMQMNPDQTAFSETIRGALEPVFADFQQAMMAFTSRYNEPLQTIYVCGGTSLLPGLPEYLSHRWQKKVQPLKISSLYPQLSIQPQKSVEWILPLATALGLSQVPGEARSQINFRSGKLHSASRGLKLNFQQFVYPAKLALTIYVVAILSVIGQTFLLSRQREAKTIQLERAMQSVLGRSPPSLLASLIANPARLKSNVDRKVEEAQAQVKGTGAGAASYMLEFIKQLSQGVPASVTTEIKTLDMQGKRLALTMESPSQGEATKTLSLLQQLPIFESPKSGPIEGKGTRKRFTLNTTVKTLKEE